MWNVEHKQLVLNTIIFFVACASVIFADVRLIAHECSIVEYVSVGLRSRHRLSPVIACLCRPFEV